MQAVFDGHNDVLLRLWQNARRGSDPVGEFVTGTDQGHIDAPRSKAGGLVGGLCAIYVPSGDLVLAGPDGNGHYATPLSAPIERLPSLGVAVEMADIAVRLDRAEAWKLCRSTAEIRSAIGQGTFASVLHMEGCEAIDAELCALETFHAAGLRSLGPVWSRNNVFAHGVPFAFPMDPDTGPGLTDAGKRLVVECNRLGIVVDLAHMTEQGFWDVARLSDQPLVVSHSNAHAITPAARNLTDRQIDAIRERKGLVGVNLAVAMLRPDGRENADTPVSDVVRHIDHMVGRLGVEGVAIGSDFDGATVPAVIGDAAGLQKLVAGLRDAGYADADLSMICRDNWLRVLASAWRE